jgi:hypothetical protein
MADFNVRSESVNVEQIMEQIRERIREKRGVDYTEEQIRELAAVKLQKFLDPKGIRSDLLDQFKKAPPPEAPPNYAFEENTLFDSHRGGLRAIRRLLRPVLKLFFNPNPLIQALNIQSRLNTMAAERETSRRATEALYYELIHNLVIETTRLGIEVKNLTMRVESLSSRLEFNERRARALESAVVYRSDAAETGAPQAQPPRPAPQTQPPRPAPHEPAGGAPAPGSPPGEGPGQRSRRRRRRRGRHGAGPVAPQMQPAAAGPPGSAPSAPSSATAETIQRTLAGDTGGSPTPSDSTPPPPRSDEPQ